MGTDLLVQTGGASTSVQNTADWRGLLLSPYYRGSLCKCRSSSETFRHRPRAMKYSSRLAMLPSLKKNPPKTYYG